MGDPLYGNRRGGGAVRFPRPPNAAGGSFDTTRFDSTVIFFYLVQYNGKNGTGRGSGHAVEKLWAVLLVLALVGVRDGGGLWRRARPKNRRPPGGDLMIRRRGRRRPDAGLHGEGGAGHGRRERDGALGEKCP